MDFLRILLFVLACIMALFTSAIAGGCIQRYGKCSTENSNCCAPSECYFSFNQCF
uniref:U-reduvitoxin-Pr7a n=1 Tax=Platymeris rhadamanthus TaxID=1134088 RepID=PLK7A_PLARH|nr:RecName: Full=U-reduvitoxin-Pr7a; Short=U-RDTX-Pr7a; Flags: Precursor [Platymeris rhadamanthus]QHB21540.1 venom Ptu1 family peptide Pr7a [Platymeris rhadamanthus]